MLTNGTVIYNHYREKYTPGEENKEGVVSKEEIRYKGKLFEVVTEPVQIEGKTFEFEKVRRSPGVRLIIGDGLGNILLTREFRRELSKFDYRLPDGKEIQVKNNG